MSLFDDHLIAYSTIFSFTGVFPYNSRGPTLKLNKITACVFTTVLFFSAYFTIQPLTSVELFWKTESFKAVNGSASILAICWSLSWVSNLFRKHYLQEFFQISRKATRVLGRIPPQCPVHVVVLLILATLHVISSVTAFVNGNHPFIIKWAMFTHIVIHIALFPYFCLLLICSFLKKLCYIISETTTVFRVDNSIITIFSTLDHLHWGLKHIQAFHGFQVFITSLQAFVKVTRFLLNLYKYHKLNAYMLIFTSTDVSIFVLLVYMLIDVCECITAEAKRFNDLLTSLALQDGSKKVLTNPYVSMHFSNKRSFQFKACGCFNIDYRLGCSMIAACVTYLVILVDLDDGKTIGTPSTPCNCTV